MFVSHDLTPSELGQKTIRERQYLINREILASSALRQHRSFHEQYPSVFGEIACTYAANSFKKVVHEIYARHGLKLHEFA